MLTKLLFTNLLLVIWFSANSQIIQSQRFEFPIDAHDVDGFQVASVKENGVILFRNTYSNDGNDLHLIHTDTSFQIKWSGFLPVDKNFELVNHASLGQYLYLIFFRNYSPNHDFHLYQINLESGDYLRYVIPNSIPFYPNLFEPTSKGVLLGGYYVRVPIVVFFNLASQQSKILPGLFNEPGELNQIQVNQDNTFDVLIRSKSHQSQNTLWVKKYDAEGKLLRNATLIPQEESNFIFGQTIQTNDVQIIAGVYGKNRNAKYSRGIFVADVTSEETQPVQFYSFADLQNFFKYLRAKKEFRKKQKFERKRIKGKEIRFQYRFIVHEFVPYKDYFILLGEAFYPKYRRQEELYGNALVMGDLQVFDGYQYTHAAIMGISKEGKLLWDNSFEINDVKTFTLQQFVKMDLQEDAVTLLYLFDNKIRTKIIRDSTVVEGKTYSPLTMKFDDSIPSDEDTKVNKLDYWYNNNFLAYGIQTTYTPTRWGSRKQKVFFINKVRYAR